MSANKDVYYKIVTIYNDDGSIAGWEKYSTNLGLISKLALASGKTNKQIVQDHPVWSSSEKSKIISELGL